MINNWRSISGHLDNLRVVLVATRNPLNIGAAARAMSNFGVRRLRVVNPYEAAFREARSAVGAAGLLARAEQYGSVAEAVADCRLVGGTTAGGGRAGDQTATEGGTGGITVRLGKGGAVESGIEPLPLGDADSDARRARFDESGAGGGGMPVRTGARRESDGGKNCAREKGKEVRQVARSRAADANAA